MLGAQRKKARIPSDVPIPLAVLWIGHLVLVPFYVLPSGLPQPADGVVAVFAIATFATLGVQSSGPYADFRRMLMAVWYVAFVGIISALIGQQPLLLMYPAFYVFNAMALCAVAVHLQRSRETFLRLTFWGMGASVALQVLLIPVAPARDVLRATLFFNNPNQLGYYAVVAACILALPRVQTRAQRIMQVAGLGCCVLLAGFSLSKASLGALACLFALMLVRRRGFGTMVAIGLASVLVISNADELSDRIYSRVMTRETDESLSARGYDRILAHPEYLIFGAGEGRTERFSTDFKGEIHSTFATLLFSYGAVGFGLTAWFFWGFARRRPLAVVSAFLPLAVYGVTHNGLRSTLAWEFVGVVACTLGAAGRNGTRLALPRLRGRSVRPLRRAATSAERA